MNKISERDWQERKAEAKDQELASFRVYKFAQSENEFLKVGQSHASQFYSSTHALSS